MKITPPTPHRAPTHRQMFDRKMFLLGITEQEKLARLWDEELAKIEAARAEAGYRPGNRHGSE